MPYLLDTNIINHLSTGNEKVIAKLAPVFDECYISGIAIEEILYQGIFAEINSLRNGKRSANWDQIYTTLINRINDLSSLHSAPLHKCGGCSVQNIRQHKTEGDGWAYGGSCYRTRIYTRYREYERF